MELVTEAQGARMISNRFGVLLAKKQAQEGRRISLTEVSEATGVSWKTLQSWQLNQVTRFDAPVLDALCAYFKVQPGALLWYAPSPVDAAYLEVYNETEPPQD